MSYAVGQLDDYLCYIIKVEKTVDSKTFSQF